MRLTDCYINLIAYVLYFLRALPNAQPPFDKVKADIQRLISESESFIKEGKFTPEEYDLSRFAVFSWVDEAIINSSWREKDQWLREPLQRVYYQTADAGELFFERLNTVGMHQRDVREVYYLCLVMGFMGRYCHEGDEFLLDQLKTSNLKLLIGGSLGVPSLEKENQFPGAYAVESSDVSLLGPTRRLSWFPFFCLGFPVIFFFALFFVFSFVLNNLSENILGMSIGP